MKFLYICDIIIPMNKIVGVDYNEGPPVPIPNTEVKLISAEDTWLETARDNRKMPTHESRYPIGYLVFIYFEKYDIKT